jgi:CubicO group peptidase (beta-lactamase class C family)
MIRILPILSLAALAFFNAAATAANPEGQAPGADSGPLHSALQPMVDKHIVAGAVARVANGSKVLDLESVGYQSLETKEPMRNDDLFWIASMTKSMTATALMMLVDEGKVNISDPVEKYLPEFKGQMVAEGQEAPHPPRHPITIREIMSHTSGLIPASDPALRNIWSLKEIVAKAAAAPLIHEPGTKYQYNNTGINTGGRIIEVVSGMAYTDFMQKRLLDPLGMKDTTFWPTEAQAKRLARTARFTEDKSGLEEVKLDKNLTQAAIDKFSHGVAVPAPMLSDFGQGIIFDYANHYGQPAGGLYSTASDIGKVCQMLLNGGVFEGKRYLSAEAVQQMTSDQTGQATVSPDEGYGIGWSTKKKDNEGPTPGSFGHRGARRTMMWVDPKNQLVMVLLVERFDMTGEQQKQLYPAFMRAAIEHFGKGR